MLSKPGIFPDENWIFSYIFVSYLFDEIDTSLQVQPEVNEFPFNTFPLVFFLFKNEHVVVKELLQFFIGEVDAKLLEGVELNTIITYSFITIDSINETYYLFDGAAINFNSIGEKYAAKDRNV